MDLLSFANENPAYAGLMGVLVGALLNIGANRAMHVDRAAREDRSARRRLYGDYLTLVEEYRTAQVKYDRKKRALAKSLNWSSKQLRSLTKLPVWASEDAARKFEELHELDIRRREIDKKIVTLQFEISLERGPDAEDHWPVLKAMRAAETGGEFAAAREAYEKFCFLDVSPSRKAKRAYRRDYEAAMARYRKRAKDRYDALKRRRDADKSPSGAGHHGTDNESTSETQGDLDASIDHDEPGNPPGDRQ